MSNSIKVGFIGAGNMAGSLVGGMIARGQKASSIWLSDPNSKRLQQLKSSYRINVAEDNHSLVATCDVLIVAVKPQVMASVLKEVADSVRRRQPLVVSIAAGIPLQLMERLLGDEVAIVRCMPNTPAQVEAGATALYANHRVTRDQKAVAESLLRAVGVALWVDEEEQLNAVTALSGSGPAYYFYVMEAMIEAGEAMGLPRETVRQLTLQTAWGAAQLAITSAEEVAVLRQNVTSPGGTTAAALEQFDAQNLKGLFKKAMLAARDRSEALASLAIKGQEEE